MMRMLARVCVCVWMDASHWSEDVHSMIVIKIVYSSLDMRDCEISNYGINYDRYSFVSNIIFFMSPLPRSLLACLLLSYILSLSPSS